MSDMGWTEFCEAEEKSQYAYWGEAIDSEIGTVYEESVVLEMRDALLAALPVVEEANHLGLDQLVSDIRRAIASAGRRPG